MRDVVRDRFFSFSTKHEGRFKHMYLDTKGFVTVGIGNMLPTASAAASLPFTNSDGSMASIDKKMEAWEKVKAAVMGLIPRVDGTDAYGRLTDIRLSNAAIDTLVMGQLGMHDAALRREFRGYEDFPSDAQLGLLSMRWPGRWNDFKKFRAHVKDGNWFAAAKECFFSEKDTRGIRNRNIDNRRLFSLAGRVMKMGLPPEPLYFDEFGAHKVYLFQGGKYIRYDWDSDSVDFGGASSSLAMSWRLSQPFSGGVDAALDGLGEWKDPLYYGKTYFFREGFYACYDWDTESITHVLPLTAWGLRDKFAQRIDAALNGEEEWFGKAYFFKDDEYVRYDWAREVIDQKPISIAEGWDLPEPFASGIDAVVSGEGQFANGLYFFKDDKYISCQWKPYKVLGPARFISDGWRVPKEFSSNLSAAVNAAWWLR